jgi:SAM-dependent methyltransferase
MTSRFSEIYDAVYSAAGKDYCGEAERLKALIEKHGLSGRRSLLDVACGTGRHLEHLAGDFEAVGLDSDPDMLAIARRRLPEVALHEADMRRFDLARTFDVVTCLFSAVGYMQTVEELQAAVTTMARHVSPGGLLVIEPWIFPEQFREGHFEALLVDEPELKIARIGRTQRRGDGCTVIMHFLVGTPAGTECLEERIPMGLFTHGQYEKAFTAAGLSATFDSAGLMGRGLFLGAKGR